MRSRLLTITFLLGVLLAAPALAGERVLVAVSVPPLAYFAERIGGELIETQVLLPPGASHATYEPTARQMVALSRAALYIEVGHPDFTVERRYLPGLREAAPQMKLVSLAEGVTFRKLEAHDDDHHEHGETDPHLWLSPRIVRALAPRIAAALKGALPGREAELEKNLAAFRSEIDTLDAELRAAFDRFHGRSFVVYHPAWGYFADDYNLSQLAVESGGKDPGAAHLVRITAALRKISCKVVFVQQGFSDRGARVVAAEIGARVETLDPLAREWSANLRRTTKLLVEALER